MGNTSSSAHVWGMMLSVLQGMVVALGLCKGWCCAVGLACRHVAAGIRVNMVVALADLAGRFPNVLEPWTDHIYQTLAGGQWLTIIQEGAFGPAQLQYTISQRHLHSSTSSSQMCAVCCLQH